jgi:hypothetical protein
MAHDPLKYLKEGCTLLNPILNPHGFRLRSVESGKGSGGYFARAEYQNEDRKLELHYRFSLGLVAYHFGETSLPHESYMRAILGKAGGNRYPGFPDNPRDSFLDLKYDLEHYADGFLTGNGPEFERCAKLAREFEALSGIARLP